jgi:hypothetical protein
MSWLFLNGSRSPRRRKRTWRSPAQEGLRRLTPLEVVEAHDSAARGRKMGDGERRYGGELCH